MRWRTVGRVVLVVAMILALPALVLWSQYSDYVVRSMVSEGDSLADGMREAVDEAHRARGSPPPSNADAGLPAPASITGSYVSRMTVGPGGMITATYSSKPPQQAHASIDGATLVFAPAADGTWTCRSDSIQQRDCPSKCDCL